jgi:hypothetical protein
MKLDDFDLVALGFFVPRMAEGPDAVLKHLTENKVSTNIRNVRIWLNAAEKTGLLARLKSDDLKVRIPAKKYSLTHTGFVTYHNNLAARQRKQRRRMALSGAQQRR